LEVDSPGVWGLKPEKKVHVRNPFCGKFLFGGNQNVHTFLNIFQVAHSYFRFDCPQ